MTATRSLEERIDRLSRASQRQLIDPDVDVVGQLGAGQVLPDELLSIHGLDLPLSTDQKARLAREEVAAVMDLGIRFEAVLMAGFCFELAARSELNDARSVFALHEVGEETRHSRLFLRVIDQLQPASRSPFVPRGRLSRWLETRSNFAIVRRQAFFLTLVLGGEEMPDLLQKLAGEHPDTDPFLAAVNRYHRQEEARHLSYARLRIPEVWADASWADRVTVRYVAPVVLHELFHMLVHPGVYGAVGLPKWRTWRAVRRLPQRREMLRRATRPVLKALIDGGALRPGRIPRPWRLLCAVDRDGRPRAQLSSV
ncbi:diiron oxygenase [Mycobacterium sp. pUA109]|uniref:diiron oxygenase n=1 Tax=Mycobacterium sp. pUA109 TaxID=3238982 RepID=UPI00351BD34E